MASTKITELNAANNIAASDLLVVVTDPSGSPTTKKITTSNLANSVLTVANTIVRKVSVPPSANSTGSPNQVAWDANNVYVCVANNTWKRISLTSF